MCLENLCFLGLKCCLHFIVLLVLIYSFEWNLCLFNVGYFNLVVWFWCTSLMSWFWGFWFICVAFVLIIMFLLDFAWFWFSLSNFVWGDLLFLIFGFVVYDWPVVVFLLFVCFAVWICCDRFCRLHVLVFVVWRFRFWCV